jgi:hypothetical protein
MKKLDGGVENMVVSIEEAARIVGCSAQWLRRLERDGFFSKTERGQARLQDVIRAVERSIIGMRSPSLSQDQ